MTMIPDQVQQQGIARGKSLNPPHQQIMKRKILIIADSSGSLIDFRGKLIEALTLNNEVNIFTPKILKDHIRTKLLEWKVIIHENSLNGSNVSIASDIKYILDLYKTIRIVKPDVVFPYAFKPVIYGGLVAAACRVKHITPMLTGLGNTFQDNNAKRIVKALTKNLLKLTLNSRKGLKIIFHNDDDRKTLIQNKIISQKSRTFVVSGSGVDLEHYSYSSPPDAKTLTFLMIARLINAKGVREFYQAALILGEKYPAVRFQLAGPYDDNVDAIDQDLYDKIRSGSVLNYLGEVDDIRSLIRESSIVVLPSYREGLPRCMLEAMAMGRGIITTDSVGCKETISTSENYPNGFLVPVKDVCALVSKMEYFINNRPEVLRFGENGRRYAVERFDVHKVNRDMLRILEASDSN